MRLINDDTDETWRHFGAKDPYYGVISADEFREDRVDDNARLRFIQGGEREIASLMSWLIAAGFSIKDGRAIDFGCGVGRLTLPLADRFRSVVGVDISPHMLAETMRNATNLCKSNISVSETVPTASDFDFVHSLVVLQHIKAERGIAIIYDLWERLRTGGLLCLQVPTGFNGSRRRQLIREVRKALPLIQIPINISRGHPWNDPGMQMNIYDINRISQGLFERGANSVTLHRKDSSENYVGSYIIARRA